MGTHDNDLRQLHLHYPQFCLIRTCKMQSSAKASPCQSGTWIPRARKGARVRLAWVIHCEAWYVSAAEWYGQSRSVVSPVRTALKKPSNMSAYMSWSGFSGTWQAPSMSSWDLRHSNYRSHVNSMQSVVQLAVLGCSYPSCAQQRHQDSFLSRWPPQQGMISLPCCEEAISASVRCQER